MREKNGQKSLSLVAHKWESNNFMKWPKDSRKMSQAAFVKLLKNGNSDPLPDWENFKCKLKRSDLEYNDGVIQMKAMSREYDTEPTDSDTAICQNGGLPNSISKRELAKTKKGVDVGDFRTHVSTFLCIQVYIYLIHY